MNNKNARFYNKIVSLNTLSVSQQKDKFKSSFFPKYKTSIWCKGYCRCYQKMLQTASYFINWRRPILLDGENSICQLPNIIKSHSIKRVIIITDKGIVNLGLMNTLMQGLDLANIQYFVFDETIPNPTSDIVEQAVKIYKKNKCEGIIAFGGGSPIDCAKAIGARLVKPNKSLKQMEGVLKVRSKIPPLYAIPTTAGTGSEATIASVITDNLSNVKFQIDDICLIPLVAVLDPCLTIGLPPNITSTTGMDALTHAIEAYIGKSNTKETKKIAEKAIIMIFENLEIAYLDGSNLKARENMLKASHYAGIAFTRAYVGYVHALAHAVGGMYHIPHGLANSIILPYILEYYGKSIKKI